MMTCSGSSCRHATGPGCICKCGGGNHGAQARLGWAMAMAIQPGDRTEAQNDEVETAEQQREKARKSLAIQQGSYKPSRKKPRRGDATWFFESGRSIEIVDWLIDHPTECAQIDWMADQVVAACEELLTQHPGTHRRLADHFWCDVLAALARALDEALNVLDEIPSIVSKETVSTISSRTWDLVHDERNTAKGNAASQRRSSLEISTRADRDHAAALSDVILKKAVEDLVSVLLSGVSAGAHLTLDTIVLKLRILAILFCPDPYAHRAVWDYCVVPLVKQGVVIRAESFFQRFLDMFKQPWSWPA